MASRSYRDGFAAWRRWAPPLAATIAVMVALSGVLISSYYWGVGGLIGTIAAAVTSIVMNVALPSSARETKLRVLRGSGAATIGTIVACILLRAFLATNPADQAWLDLALNGLWVFLYIATFAGCAAALTALALSFAKGQPRVTILFVTANPSDQEDPHGNPEYREIDEVLPSTEYRDQFQLVAKLSVREPDLRKALWRYRPHIVHFSGHGSTSREIVLQDKWARSYPVAADELRKLFAALKGATRLVVLNACHSDLQAEVIAQSVECVIGSAGEITAFEAMTFARELYRAVGNGDSVATAFAVSESKLDGKGKIFGPPERAQNLVFAKL